MATAEIIQHVVLDELNSEILSTANAAGVSLQELAHRLSKHGYPKLWYRIRSLEKMGLIHTANKRGKVICFLSGS